MADSSSTGTAFPFAGAIILLALGNYFWFSPPLDSYRPTVQSEEHFDHNYINEAPSRLWQDPIKTAELDYNKKKLPPAQIDFSKAKNYGDKIKVITVLLPHGENTEMEERRKRRRYAVISGLIASNYIPKETNTIKYLVDKQECSAKKTETQKITINSITKNCDISDTESVCRTNKIYNINIAQKDSAPYETQCKNNEKQDVTVIPYEWFYPDITSQNVNQHSNNTDPVVLIVWLSEKFLKHKSHNHLFGPMGKISKKLNEITSDNSLKIDYEILGPATSGTLVDMTKEYCTEKQKKFLFSKIISPVATSPNVNIFAQAGIKNTDNIKCAIFQDFIYREIPQDNELIKLLTKEIVQRFEKDKLKSENIAIISEVDTVYGRVLPTLMSRQLHLDLKDGGNIKKFGYFRGIDGITTDIQKSDTSRNLKTSQRNNERILESNIKWPIGDGQYDYLRRMSDKIKKHQIKAIGIFGNDVYDKLLVLKSLRKNFPSTLFFTTDLDARFLHPDEYPFTRNMLVASGLGLELTKESFKSLPQNTEPVTESFQGSSPPFRDSYQTSIFHAVQKILNPKKFGVKNQGAWENSLKPMLYEIGRNSAYPLFQNEKKQQNTTENTKYFLIIIVLFSIMIFFQGHLRESYSSPKLWSIFCGVIFIFLYAYVVFFSGSVEPTALLDGVSAWPGLFVRLIVICIAVYYLIKSMCLINENNDAITNEILKEKNSSDNMKQLGELMHISPRKNKSPRSSPYAFIKYRYFINAAQEAGLKKYLFRLIIQLRTNRYLIRFFLFISGLMISLTLFNLSGLNDFIIIAAYYLFCAFLIMHFMQKISTSRKIKKKNNKKKIDTSLNVIFVCCTIITMWFAYYVFVMPHFAELDSIWIYYLTYGTGVLIWYFVIRKFLLNNSGMNDDQFNKLKKLKNQSIKGLWYYHLYEGRCYRRIVRVLTYTLFYSILTSSIYALIGADESAVWSDRSAAELYHWILQASIFCTYFFIFYIVDVIDFNNKWMKDFQKLVSERPQIYESCKHTKIIADRSKVISQLIYYPFIIVLLMLIARLSYFDNWGLPLAFMLVISINFAVLFYLGYRLRYRAEELRHTILEKLKHSMISIQAIDSENEPPPSPDTIAQRDHKIAHLNSLISDIQEIKHGAFGSYWNQPILKGALILIGGISITFSEYAVLMN